MPVFVTESARPIYTVQEMVIDPVNGKIIAFVVDSRRKLVVTPIDVISIKHGLLIRDSDDVISYDDVLRVKSVVEEYGGFLHKKVETESGEVLGKVIDLSIDDRSFILNKIYTAKVILGFIQHDSRIIPAKNIVEVKDDVIVIKDSGGKVRVEERGREAGMTLAESGLN